MMQAHQLHRLLVTLDAAVDAFAICEVKPNARLILEPVDAVVVHYVLSGTLHLTTKAGVPTRCGAGTMVIVPAGLMQGLASGDGVPNEVRAADHCTMERDGMLLF